MCINRDIFLLNLHNKIYKTGVNERVTLFLFLGEVLNFRNKIIRSSGHLMNNINSQWRRKSTDIKSRFLHDQDSATLMKRTYVQNVSSLWNIRRFWRHYADISNTLW